MEWYSINKREFPWRNKNSTPFQILIAELFLRHTRATVVKGVYTNFISKFPDIKSIVNADDEKLFNIIYPLGLLNRVYEIKKIASILDQKYQGVVPKDKATLKSLPGIGEYTSSAVLIFAFNEDDIIMDTNIIRIINRVFGKQKTHQMRKLLLSLSKNSNKKEFYNMCLDFGALICKARNPNHFECPIKKFCLEYYNSGICLDP